MHDRYLQPQSYIDEQLKFIAALHREHAEIEQVLGYALGYPLYSDDQENFPGTTDADGVATGDHTPVTLAIEAAKLIEEVRKTTLIDYVNKMD